MAFADGQLGDDEEEELKAFEFPRFGLSPGPTPSPSTPSAHTPSDFDVSSVRWVEIGYYGMYLSILKKGFQMFEEYKLQVTLIVISSDFTKICITLHVLKCIMINFVYEYS